MSCTADRVVPRRQVDGDVHGGGEALVPVLAQQIVVGGRQEPVGLLLAEQPAERARQQQRARAGLHALARDVDEDHLQPASVRRSRGDDEVARERLPVCRLDGGLRVPPAGQVGSSPNARSRSRRSTNIDSPRLPWTPSRARERGCRTSARRPSRARPARDLGRPQPRSEAGSDDLEQVDEADDEQVAGCEVEPGDDDERRVQRERAPPHRLTQEDADAQRGEQEPGRSRVALEVAGAGPQGNREPSRRPPPR